MAISRLSYPAYERAERQRFAVVVGPPLEKKLGSLIAGAEILRRLDAAGIIDAVGVDHFIRAGQAACSCRMPPSRSRLRIGDGGVAGDRYRRGLLWCVLVQRPVWPMQVVVGLEFAWQGACRQCHPVGRVVCPHSWMTPSRLSFYQARKASRSTTGPGVPRCCAA